MPGDRLQYLLEKYHAGTCTPGEKEELENWYNQLSATNQPFAGEESEEAGRLKEDMLKEFRRRMKQPVTPVLPISRKKWVYRLVAAAAALVVLSIAIYYLTGTKKEDTIVKKDTPVTPQDILPGGNHATLTLADGTSILLDTAKQDRKSVV